jgi:hypothetical protein
VGHGIDVALPVVVDDGKRNLPFDHIGIGRRPSLAFFEIAHKEARLSLRPLLRPGRHHRQRRSKSLPVRNAARPIRFKFSPEIMPSALLGSMAFLARKLARGFEEIMNEVDDIFGQMIESRLS